MAPVDLHGVCAKELIGIIQNPCIQLIDLLLCQSMMKTVSILHRLYTSFIIIVHFIPVVCHVSSADQAGKEAGLVSHFHLLLFRS